MALAVAGEWHPREVQLCIGHWCTRIRVVLPFMVDAQRSGRAVARRSRGHDCRVGDVVGREEAVGRSPHLLRI